jgi:ABC-2 type transport system permease protein
MFTIYKKEITGFFSSITGYVVIVVFLLLNSLFIWVFKGEMNVLDNSYASLDTLFAIAPWVFLFLVPAITMRMFSEEKRSGTLELLFTRPVREFEIVSGKFLAAWTLVLLAIIPTLIFFISVSLLGSPPGNIDTGGTWGSYLGLLFLGGIYTGIGIFSSSLTENQVVAFITAVFFSFLFYLGFSYIGSISHSGEIVYMVEKFGIDFHYQSISRGVIDSRDVIYFFSVMAVFIWLTNTVLQSRKW